MKKLFLISLLFLIVSGCAITPEMNPSQELWDVRAEGWDTLMLCTTKDSIYAKARSDEHRYKVYTAILNELEKRDFDCKSIPETADKEEWWEGWVKEYEESLEK